MVCRSRRVAAGGRGPSPAGVPRRRQVTSARGGPAPRRPVARRAAARRAPADARPADAAAARVTTALARDTPAH